MLRPQLISVNRKSIARPGLDRDGGRAGCTKVRRSLADLHGDPRRDPTVGQYLIVRASEGVGRLNTRLNTPVFEYDGATLPGVIGPNDSGITSWVLPYDEDGVGLSHFERGGTIYAWAWTSTGRAPLKTQPSAIDDLPRRDDMRRYPRRPMQWRNPFVDSD